jgi:hypothetical protein
MKTSFVRSTIRFGRAVVVIEAAPGVILYLMGHAGSMNATIDLLALNDVTISAFGHDAGNVFKFV